MIVIIGHHVKILENLFKQLTATNQRKEHLVEEKKRYHCFAPTNKDSPSRSTPRVILFCLNCDPSELIRC
jgi:hypothetical protein